MDNDCKELMDKMQEILPKKRYLHSLSVAYLSSSLAMCYGIDSIKAFKAGILHDCAKYEKEDVILNKCLEEGLEISLEQQKFTLLLHAVLGAYYAKKIYGIEDEDILNAIKYHSVGRPAMSMLEKIIFVADYIEIGRIYSITPSLDELRKLAFTDIDKVVYFEAKNTIDYLTSKGKDIDRAIFDTMNFYSKM